MNDHGCICHLILISNFRRNCKKAQHYDLSLPIPVIFPFLLSIPVKDHYKSKFLKPFSFPSQHFHLSLGSGRISLCPFFSLPKTVFSCSITDSQGNSLKHKHHQHFKSIILKLIWNLILKPSIICLAYKRSLFQSHPPSSLVQSCPRAPSVICPTMNAERMALSGWLESSNSTEEPCWHEMEFLFFSKQGYNPAQALELSVMGSEQGWNKSSL